MSNISDAHWDLIKHLFEVATPGKTVGRPRVCSRAIYNAIQWVADTGEPWKRLPSTYPSQQTCYSKLIAWKKEGLLERAREILAAVKEEQPPQGEVAA